MLETYHAAAAPTPEQQEVILSTEQPLLVIAGPGAGKGFGKPGNGSRLLDDAGLAAAGGRRAHVPAIRKETGCAGLEQMLLFVA